MKTDRLIGILSILLQEEKTTAPRLAERFEVSRRTINRDIEDLSKAGIPVRTVQGTGGGISIMDGYRMDRTILTSKDMQMILVGLRSLDSVSGSSYYSRLMEKVQAGSSEFVSGRDSM
ncbi:MAG: HTH domain-containing protein, partial [Lachnospiraceae bacterium]|nr:HTH domain-containing protein [Lachnospiraceae bacterium]